MKHPVNKRILTFFRLSIAIILLLFAAGCQNTGGNTLRILSGSENKELEEVLAACEKETGVNIEMTYEGSIDIMRTLDQGASQYDAVWPASSLWISLGDTQHKVKHAQSVSTTPVVFGIRQSLAKELGFTQGDVSVKDILAAIRQDKLTFCMTSASQSNSGASAYIGFLYALLEKKEALTKEDLQNPQLQEEIRSLLAGIDRSSGSSDWLKDMFLKGNYDAMVNYECLMISANEQLEQEGRETLSIVYPYDGLSIADSPLGFVDSGDGKKQEAFLKVQEYLLSEQAQNAIQKTGRRTGYSGIDAENAAIFRKDWGIDTERILSPVTMPSADVLMTALNMYQTQFKKPSLTVYCLDFSGSMAGRGNQQMVQAMAQILVQSKASQNLLQASQGEVNIVLPFSSYVLSSYAEETAAADRLEALYNQIAAQECIGGTDIYAAAIRAMEELGRYDLSAYTPAVILMTDGKSNGSYSFHDFQAAYQAAGMDIPVFSILFGDAQAEQLDELASYTNGRVFDGTDDLIAAFRSVKGYN